MQSRELNLSGIWVPLVTPFKGGAVDHAGLRRIVARCADGGVAGFVVCGSTGEPWALDDAEQHAVLQTVLDAARGLPFLMGLAGNHEGALHARLQQWAEAPIAGFLVPAPYYVRPSQAGLLRWYGAIADASPRPIVLYDIPYRTGVRIEAATALQLAAHPNIVGIKDCGGDPAATQALIADGRLQVLAGEDAQILATLCLGGVGAIAASAHVRTERFVAMYRAVAERRLDDARRIAQELAPLIRALFAEPNPAPLKALLAHEGLISDEVRPPLVPASAQLCAQLVAL
jgi:4-hydroxy-tetrahydrodipicolinate synthase